MGKKFVFTNLRDAAGLHSECIMGSTVLELCNDERVLIENIRHVISFDTNQITIAVSFGSICMDGCDLVFDYLGEDRILIKGTIGRITVHREDRRK